MLEIIMAILVVFFFITNDEEFLDEGQHRDFFGNILDADGELNISGTPLLNKMGGVETLCSGIGTMNIR